MPKAFPAKYEGAFSHDTKDQINKNFFDVGYCSTELDKTTDATLQDIPGMISGTLAAGTYIFYAHVSGTSGASGGMKLAFNYTGNTALGSIESVGRGMTASAIAVQHTTTTTAQTSLFAATGAYIDVVIEGTVVVTVPGTLQLQFAQNASNGTASSVYVGSYMTFIQIA